MKTLIATIIGPDRPGLVGMLSETVSANGGNWTASSMSQLAGQFAGMFQVEVSDENSAALQSALEMLSENGVQISVVSGAEAAAAVSDEALSHWKLSLVGQDRSGIVSRISSVIASLGINVEDLETKTESAPMSGEMHFKAEALLSGPKSVDLDEIRRAIEAIALDLMVEVSPAD